MSEEFITPPRKSELMLPPPPKKVIRTEKRDRDADDADDSHVSKVSRTLRYEAAIEEEHKPFREKAKAKQQELENDVYNFYFDRTEDDRVRAFLMGTLKKMNDRKVPFYYSAILGCIYSGSGKSLYNIMVDYMQDIYSDDMDADQKPYYEFIKQVMTFGDKYAFLQNFDSKVEAGNFLFTFFESMYNSMIEKKYTAFAKEILAEPVHIPKDTNLAMDSATAIVNQNVEYTFYRYPNDTYSTTIKLQTYNHAYVTGLIDATNRIRTQIEQVDRSIAEDIKVTNHTFKYELTNELQGSRVIQPYTAAETAETAETTESVDDEDI